MQREWNKPWVAPVLQCVSGPCSASHPRKTALLFHPSAVAAFAVLACCTHTKHIKQYHKHVDFHSNSISQKPHNCQSTMTTFINLQVRTELIRKGFFFFYLSMLRIWLWRARKDTGESMASRLLAQRRTTFSPVWWIFSVSWSTAILLGAHTRTGLGPKKKQCNVFDQAQETA